MDEAEIESINGHQVMGDEPSRGILHNFHTLNDKTNDLQSQIDDLKRNSDRFLSVRSRTLDVFCRDHLRRHVSVPRINRVHARVHEGDLVTDVELYDSQKRLDFDVFEKVYGITVDTAMRLGEFTADYHLQVRAMLTKHLVDGGAHEIIGLFNRFGTQRLHGDLSEPPAAFATLCSLIQNIDIPKHISHNPELSVAYQEAKKWLY